MSWGRPGRRPGSVPEASWEAFSEASWRRAGRRPGEGKGRGGGGGEGVWGRGGGGAGGRRRTKSRTAEHQICDSSAHRHREHAHESSTLSAASALCYRSRTSQRTPPSVRWRLASARDRLMSAESMVGHTSTNLQSEGVQSQGHTYAFSCTSFMNNEQSRVSAAHKSCEL